MFTGLVKDLGIIKKASKNTEGVVFIIQTKLISEIKIDDSVAVNGVCLTATKIFEDSFAAQAVHLTLEKTSLGVLQEGSHVNLELALRYSDRLGGHLVQGHVNGSGMLKSVSHRGENYEIWFTVPSEFKKYIVKEGSIALDGISLTVADLNFENQDSEIMVTIIPHTWEFTNLKNKKTNDKINIEVDMMAKYLENFVKYNR